MYLRHGGLQGILGFSAVTLAELGGIVGLAYVLLATPSTPGSTIQTWGWVACGVVVVAVLTDVTLTVLRRARFDEVRQEVIFGLLGLLHKGYFERRLVQAVGVERVGNYRLRYTVFIVDPVLRWHDQEIIVPYVRWEPGATSPDADSRAWYPRNSSAISAEFWRRGMTLREARGRTDVYLSEELPPFDDADEMRGFYTGKLGIERDVVDCLSDELVGVAQFFSYAITEPDGRFRALLSVDLPIPFEGSKPIKPPQKRRDGGDPVLSLHEFDTCRAYLDGIEDVILELDIPQRRRLR